MRFSTIFAIVLPIAAAFAQTNHVVQVGANGTLTFTPNQLTVNAGETVSFQFLSKNHSVSQSSFVKPCTLLQNPDGTTGVDSGFQFVPANSTSFQQWTFTVNNASAPLWFYCRQTNPASHCAAGMVFAINPTANKTFAAFQQTAMATGSNSSSASSTSAAAGGATGSVTPTGGVGGATASPSASASGATNGGAIIKAGGSAGVLLTGAALIVGLVL